MKRIFIATLILMFIGTVVFSQSDSISKYDPHQTFAPFYYPSNGHEFRSAGGQPGPAYWQNNADYKIAVSLNTTEEKVTGFCHYQV